MDKKKCAGFISGLGTVLILIVIVLVPVGGAVVISKVASVELANKVVIGFFGLIGFISFMFLFTLMTGISVDDGHGNTKYTGGMFDK